jgi:hypothetical protein
MFSLTVSWLVAPVGDENIGTIENISGNGMGAAPEGPQNGP